MPSINVDLNFFSHRKTMRLIAQLGDLAVTGLFRLWCYTAQHYPDTGVLSDLTDVELEYIMQWTGAPGELVKVLIGIGFLDVVGSTCHIHDWKDHAGHLVIYRERARKAAVSRHEKYSTLANSNNLQISSLTNSNVEKLPASSMLQANSQLILSTSSASSMLQASLETHKQCPNTIQGNTIQDNTKKKSSALQVRKPSPPTVINEDWLKTVTETYSWVDVQREVVKCQTWCEVNRKAFSRRRFINWINRIEKPFTPITQKKYEGSYHKKVVL